MVGFAASDAVSSLPLVRYRRKAERVTRLVCAEDSKEKSGRESAKTKGIRWRATRNGWKQRTAFHLLEHLLSLEVAKQAAFQGEMRIFMSSNYRQKIAHDQWVFRLIVSDKINEGRYGEERRNSAWVVVRYFCRLFGWLRIAKTCSLSLLPSSVAGFGGVAFDGNLCVLGKRQGNVSG